MGTAPLETKKYNKKLPQEKCRSRSSFNTHQSKFLLLCVLCVSVLKACFLVCLFCVFLLLLLYTDVCLCVWEKECVCCVRSCLHAVMEDWMVLFCCNYLCVTFSSVCQNTGIPIFPAWTHDINATNEPVWENNLTCQRCCFNHGWSTKLLPPLGPHSLKGWITQSFQQWRFFTEPFVEVTIQQ